jgi:hypothetical protein
MFVRLRYGDSQERCARRFTAAPRVGGPWELM